MKRVHLGAKEVVEGLLGVPLHLQAMHLDLRLHLHPWICMCLDRK